MSFWLLLSVAARQRFDTQQYTAGKKFCWHLNFAIDKNMLIFNSVNTIILSQVSYFLMHVFIYHVGYMYTALRI